MKKSFIVNRVNHTFEFGRHVNGTDIIKDSYILDGREITNWTTVFDVLPQTADEAERMLKSKEWHQDKNDIAV